MGDGIQRATSRQVRAAWEFYAVTKGGMGAEEALRAFDNWIDSIRDESK